VTVEARDVLTAARTVYLRTRTHPTADHLPTHLTIHTFDYLYEREADFAAIYTQIADELLRLASAAPPDAPIVYAVPGHPLVGEAAVRAVLPRARAAGLPMRLVAGLSFLEPVCTALDLDPLAAGLQILDGTELIGVGGPSAPQPDHPQSVEPFLFSPYSLPVPPDAFPALQGLTPMKPLLVTQVYNDRVAGAVKLALLERYPAEHPVRIVMAAGVPGQEQVIAVPLHELDRGHAINHLACIYLPPVEPLANVRDLDTLIYIMGRLRGPGGCPWDRQQTHQSLKHSLIEEAYEAVEALDTGDLDGFAEELGDLLLLIVFHAQLAVSADEFTLADVTEHVVTKLIRRHPHVFGEAEVADAAGVLANWERIKAAEKATKGAREGTADADLEVTAQLRSVPKTMPALESSLEISQRAVAAGFEWANIDDVYAKVREELDELRRAPEAERFEEFGDLLFTLVNIARWLKINPEEALRAFNRKFIARYAAAERLAVADGHRMRALPVEAQDRYWQAAKQRERDV
jgi:tetrapyrrole methylase family protein/MazG family protein